MRPISSRISRRKFLAGALGISFALALGRPPRPALSLEPERRGLAWVWEFARDGEPDELGAALLASGLGIVLKTHDGLSWMADFDTSAYAVSGRSQAGTLADYFESGGVPFHAWCVIRGIDPVEEARMAAGVLEAGARSLYVDPGPYVWEGDTEAARRYGAELRARQPEARLHLVLDPRSWLMEDVPLSELAAFCDGVAVKAFWTAYDTADDIAGFTGLGYTVPEEGVTADFTYVAGLSAAGRFDLPVAWIADGAAPVAEFGEFLDLVSGSEAESPVSVWRFGTTNEAVLALLEERVGPSLRYTVQLGDTLSEIAEAHGSSLAALIEANSLEDADRIWEGQELRIPQ